jgi:hypothetical protein
LDVSPLGSFLEEIAHDQVELLGHPTDKGVVSIDGTVMNSDDKLWLNGEDREGMRGIGMDRRNKQFTVELLAIL